MITYTHHKQRIKDYKDGVRLNAFKIQVCVGHQVKKDRLKEKQAELLKKLELYIQEAIEAGYYELVI